MQLYKTSMRDELRLVSATSSGTTKVSDACYIHMPGYFSFSILENESIRVGERVRRDALECLFADQRAIAFVAYRTHLRSARDIG